MSSVTIIAEIGINHNGSQDTARELISAAAAAGVHAVKFQYRNLENAYSGAAREIGDEILLREIKKNYLDPQVLLDLAAYAQSLGVQAGTSFFDAADMADFGTDIDAFEFFKLPSAELTNAKLIDAMLRTGRHVFLSTGCHSEREVEEALGRLLGTGWTPMHCISNYPTSLQNARLGYLKHMRARWDRSIGYSSHDDSWEVCLLAMQLGAMAVERHITLDKRTEGLDHSSSSTPDEFARMCTFGANMDLLLAGDGPRVPNQGELLNRQNLGRSFFAGRDIEAGEQLVADALVYRSPNTGLGRAQIGEFLDRPVAVTVRLGSAITRSVFDPPGPLPAGVIEFARRRGLALPVRLHDLGKIQSRFPIGGYEFHLSFEEVRTNIDVRSIDRSNRYSIHLPDYVSSTQLMDPFSPDSTQRAASLDILERTVAFAEGLQNLTGQPVPVVGSFSVVHSGLDNFFADYAELLSRFRSRGVTVMLQWLPPIAWYFGGSVRLHAMNDLRDVHLLKQHDLPVCMDVCHLLLGRNFFGFSAEGVMQDLRSQTRHVHIADAAGIDGEGLAIGEGEPQNIEVIRKALDFDCLKVIEVWQGHLDQGAGFRKALLSLSRLFDDPS
jgi:sialic acid synthase SpsE/sugar phosphate isomerase/epimerase